MSNSIILHRKGLENVEDSLRDDNILNLYAKDYFVLSPDDTFNLRPGVMPGFDKASLNYDPSLSESENERKNVRVLYDAIKDDMSIGKAFNKMLWTTISHKHFFDYIKSRSVKGNSSKFNNKIIRADLSDLKEKKKVINLISDLFFFKKLNYRSLRRHHIAKLWLVASKTYRCWDIDGLEDLKQEDDYYYTDLALHSMDLFQAIFERNEQIAKHPILLNTVLFFLHEDKKRLKRQYYRDTFLKELVCRLLVNPVHINSSFKDILSYLHEIDKDIDL